MLNKKEVLILDLLYKNTFKYLTSQEITPYIGVSDKTIRKYIKELNEVIENDIAKIKSVPGHGFYLDIYNEIELKKLLYQNYEGNKSKTSVAYIENSKDRQYYILNLLFFENGYLTFDYILDQLFVSKSTLMDEITAINKQLQPYNLFLKTDKNTGLKVIGKEQNKRHFIMEYFFANRFYNDFKTLGEISGFLQNISLEEIFLIILDECRDYGLKLSDTIMFNSVVHISLVLKRVSHGHQIQCDVNSQNVNDSIEIEVANNIVNRIENSPSIRLPQEEISNIALHLKNKLQNKNLLASLDISKKSLQKQITAVLEKIDVKYPFHFSNDFTLIDGLVNHFILFLTRLRYGRELNNPLVEEIKIKYNDLFELTKTSFKGISVLKNINILDDEWAYITLHIIAAFERQLKEQRIHVLVICATGIGSSQMIKERLENEFGTKIIIDEVISYYEITDEKIHGIDLVISSIDLSNIILNVPIVNVSTLINEEDVKTISEIIASMSIFNSESKLEKAENSSNIKEIINEYFDADLFIINNEVKNREEALNILINHCHGFDHTIDRNFLRGQLKLRESFGSVAFSKNMAVPHPIEGASNKAMVAVLITPEGGAL